MDAEQLKSRMRVAASARGMNLIEASARAGLGRNFAYTTEHPRYDKLEAFAHAVRCCPLWLVGESDDSPIVGELPFEEDFDPRRSEIPLLTETGSQIDQACIAYGEWDGVNLTPFLARLKMAGLYDKTMFFERTRGGRWRYRYIGGFFSRSLGPYVFTAPGNLLSDVDKDKRFAQFAAEAYDEAFEAKTPLREIVDVVSDYDEYKRRFVFDRIIFPGRQGIVMMVLELIDPQYLKGLADDQASIGSLSNPARSLPAPVLQNLRVG